MYIIDSIGKCDHWSCKPMFKWWMINYFFNIQISVHQYNVHIQLYSPSYKWHNINLCHYPLTSHIKVQLLYSNDNQTFGNLWFNIIIKTLVGYFWVKFVSSIWTYVSNANNSLYHLAHVLLLFHLSHKESRKLWYKFERFTYNTVYLKLFMSQWD